LLLCFGRLLVQRQRKEATQIFGLRGMRELRHEEHVGGTLHDGEDRVIVVVYNQIHLEISKPFPICFFGALMNTGSAGNGRSLAFGSMSVLELIRQFGISLLCK